MALSGDDIAARPAPLPIRGVWFGPLDIDPNMDCLNVAYLVSFRDVESKPARVRHGRDLSVPAWVQFAFQRLTCRMFLVCSVSHGTPEKANLTRSRSALAG